MAATTNAEIRALYNTACHGAGAEARLVARRQIERTCNLRNITLGMLFSALNLNLAAYFASRPIEDSRHD